MSSTNEMRYEPINGPSYDTLVQRNAELATALKIIVTWANAAQLGNSPRSKQWTMFEQARAALAKAQS